MTDISDLNCKKRVLDAIIPAVEAARNGGFNHRELPPDALLSIEYVLKDVFRGSVPANTSREDCGKVFASLIKRLSEGSDQDWQHVKDFATSIATDLEEDAILELHSLAQECQKAPCAS